jgi:hypothetical protein
MKSIHLVPVLILLAGGRALAAAAPAWCASAGGNLSPGDLEKAQNDPDATGAVYEIVAGLCRPDGDPGKIEAFEAARQAWSKRLDMADADWADAAGWASLAQVARVNPKVRGVERKKALRQLTPVDQFGVIAALGEHEHWDAIYTADALGTHLSEAGRVAYLLSCLDTARTSNIRPPEATVHAAVCQPDIDALDRKKLADELRADTSASGPDRMAVRLLRYQLDQRLKEHADKVKKLFAKDPVYADLFQAAAGARELRLDPALVDLALAMDDARVTGSRKAHEGCAEKTRTALTAAIATLPAKKFEDLKTSDGADILEQLLGVTINDPNAYLAGLAYYNCRAGDRAVRSDYMMRKLGGTMRYWPGYRGPRTAAYTALLSAGLQGDTRDAQISVPHPEYAWMGGHGGGSDGDHGRGVIESVKPGGEGAVVSFVKKMQTQPACRNWKTTNRVDRIDDNGRLVYAQTCASWGTETVNLSDPPATIDGAYAAGLKPGMVVWIMGGYPLVAWPKSGAKTPSYVLGAAVK